MKFCFEVATVYSRYLHFLFVIYVEIKSRFFRLKMNGNGRKSDLGRGKRPNQQQAQNTKRLNRKDMDSACYRLSRIPQKYSMAKAVKAENADSFAVNYYQSHPVDTRTMQEKLEEIDFKIQDQSLEDDERFSLLVQRKSLNIMIYGESSREAIRAATDFGAFYNVLEKPESALRNLLKAYSAAQQCEDLPEEDGFLLAVELADAGLNAKQAAKEKHKLIVLADNYLTPFAEFDSGTAAIMYRKDICLARIRAYRQKFPEAIEYYDKALHEYSAYAEEEKKAEKEGKGQTEEEEDEKDRDIVEPNLYVEAAVIAEKAENNEQALDWYKAAYNIYLDRGFKRAAKRILPKIQTENEEEEEKNEKETQPEDGENNEEDTNEPNDDNPEEKEAEKPEEPAPAPEE